MNRTLMHFLSALIPPSFKKVGYGVGLGCLHALRKYEPHPRPIFILGNQKAGTTAIAMLLARMSGESVSGGLKREVFDPRYEAVKQDRIPFAQLIERNAFDFSKRIIKENHLTFFFDELKKNFPDARFVFIIRDPRDNIRSILDRVKKTGDKDLTIERSNFSVPPVWQLVIDNRWLGITETHYIRALAERWNHAASAYTCHSAQMILVRYEDFIRDKVGVITRIAQQLGMPQCCDIRAYVDIPFQPKRRHVVSWVDFFGNDNLRYIEQLCSTYMRAFGYNTLRES